MEVIFLKILIVRTYPNEINIKNYNVQEIGLAKALTTDGHQCDIVLYTEKEERTEQINVEDKQITIYWMKGTNILKNLFWPNKIFKLIEKYDIVQSCEYDQIYNLYFQKKIPQKFVIYHGPYYSEFNKRYNFKCKIFDRIFLNKKYKKVAIISKSALATKFLEKKGFRNITTLGVGLDSENLQEKNVIEKEKLKFSSSKKHLLYIGKIEERRNILFLIDILSKVIKKNKNVDLILIGKGEKEYIEMVKKYIKDLNLENYVIYIEKVEQKDLKYVYKQSNIFLLPTKYEIFGMVLLEAMYFGLPTITTLNGGSSTIIDNNVNGYIYNETEIEKWIKTINYLLEQKEKQLEIGKNAKKTIEEKYLWNKLSKEFTRVYSEVLGNEYINRKK